MPQPKFLSKNMHDMTMEEWESLCDGCGLCCQISLEDEDTGEIALTSVACRYLCLNSNRCKDYTNRHTNVVGCDRITPDNIHGLTWLPSTCGYRLVAGGHPLPSWHHLVCGDPEQVHLRGPSMRGELISEDDADCSEWQGDDTKA